MLIFDDHLSHIYTLYFYSQAQTYNN